ncbi:alpha/beta hydrolase [Streptomyces sp. VB1]|uniref:alpha/beta hydrolase n=2 Tax=unclassified Streptomyces TaxID=2593676 RepID=UPI0022425EBE|nr:alpha/beta hydrolase family protein [Streptomyces sp. VB1]UZI33341.1 esterase family protein [Streptomyces sp. VB1]
MSMARKVIAWGAAVLLLILPGTAAAAAPPGDPPPGIQVTGERWIGDRLLELTVRSAALEGAGTVRLLTPDGWEDRGPGERWPVLYLLAGGHGDPEAWTEDYAVERLPHLRDVLVVMPSMPLFGFYSDWWNGGAGGAPRVESFHLDEVRPLLERLYGAGDRRVAAGESQGGFGALTYAARHPGLFRAVAGLSSYVHPLQHPRAVQAGLDYLGLDRLALWGDPVAQRRIWQDHDPYYRPERLRGVEVHLSSGDGRAGTLDPPGTEPDPHVPGLEDPDDPFPEDVLSPTEALMGAENRAMASRLRAHGVAVTTHFYRGTHSPPYWERELRDALPALLRSLGR